MVDDGSADPVEDIVMAYKDSRLSYHRRPHSGLALTRHYGVSIASGRMICFLDDDDYILPNHLASFYDASLVHGAETKLFKVGAIEETADGSRKAMPLFRNDRSALKQHWRRPEGIFPYAIPVDYARAIPSLDYFLAEDFNWLGRLMLELDVIQLPVYTAVYRVHRSNRSIYQLSKKSLAERIRAVVELYNTDPTDTLVSRNAYKRMLTHQCLHFVRQCIRQDDFTQAMYGIGKAGKYFTLSAYDEYARTVKVFLYRMLSLISPH